MGESEPQERLVDIRTGQLETQGRIIGVLPQDMLVGTSGYCSGYPLRGRSGRGLSSGQLSPRDKIGRT